MFEIDGTKNLNLDSPLAPRLEMRDDKRYVVYSLGECGARSMPTMPSMRDSGSSTRRG